MARVQVRDDIINMTQENEDYEDNYQQTKEINFSDNEVSDEYGMHTQIQNNEFRQAIEEARRTVI